MPQLAQTRFYTSHEVLLLPFEEAMTRRASPAGSRPNAGQSLEPAFLPAEMLNAELAERRKAAA